MILRFVVSQPVSQVTEEFLAWACRRLALEGKRALLLAQDNASWHLSGRVRSWIRAHKRSAKAEGGVRIVACFLAVKASWLNAIEPKLVHGKRAIIELDRPLMSAEVLVRVYGLYGCNRLDPIAQEVT